MVFGCSIFSVLSNRLGVKWILMLGTLGFAPYSASLYVNNRYGTEWFVLVGGGICGVAASALWASEGAIALGYSDVKDRGKFSKLRTSRPLPFSQAYVLIGDFISLQLEYGLVLGNLVSSLDHRFNCLSMRRMGSAAKSRIQHI